MVAMPVGFHSRDTSISGPGGRLRRNDSPRTWVRLRVSQRSYAVPGYLRVLQLQLREDRLIMMM